METDQVLLLLLNTILDCPTLALLRSQRAPWLRELPHPSLTVANEKHWKGTVSPEKFSYNTERPIQRLAHPGAPM